MSRFLHIFASVLMFTAMTCSLLTRGPVLEAPSLKIELARESKTLCQEHFLETPHLPFLFVHENNPSGLHQSNPGSPLNVFSNSGILKPKWIKSFGSATTGYTFIKKNVPIFIRVRSLRN